MKLNIYSIYDSAAKAYMSPFFMHNHGLAIRAFSDQVNSQQENQIKNHPEQFTLFMIAEYNDQSGYITPLETPAPLGKGNEFQTQETLTASVKDQLIQEIKLLLTEK